MHTWRSRISPSAVFNSLFHSIRDSSCSCMSYNVCTRAYVGVRARVFERVHGCVYVCVCLYACACADLMYEFMSVCMYVCLYPCTYVCIHTSHMHTHKTIVYMYVCKQYIRMHEYMCVWLYHMCTVQLVLDAADTAFEFISVFN